MIDRGFNETDLRQMLEDVTGFRADAMPGRWIIETTHGQLQWEAVVQPDDISQVLVVVTAYPCDI